MEKIINKIENNENELDTKLIKKLQKLGKENKYQEYLDLLDQSLEKVKIEECNEKLLYLPKHLSKDIFIKLFDPKLDFEFNNKRRHFLREGIVERLNLAQKNLPKNYHLMIGDALRTKEIVEGLYKKAFNKGKERYPELSDKEIDLWVRNLIAMPDDITPPGHMTGGAVDVVLADNKGKEIPLEIDYEITPKEEQKFTFCPGLPKEVLEKRKILFSALTQVGFHNYFREYWHYSFGDSYWAVRRKNKVAIYGIPGKELFEKVK